MTSNSILYLHGFNSSPQSVKAVQTHDYILANNLPIEFVCPQLKSSPNEVLKQLESIIQSSTNTKWYLVGSSLGGYFSTYLAEKYQLNAVLINPAVKPFELLVDYIGEQVNPYTNEVYQVTNQHMSDLQSLYKEKILKKRYMVMVQTGDEVLDYQQAVEKYHGCSLIKQKGGDHSFVGYDQMLPSIMKFLNLQ